MYPHVPRPGPAYPCLNCSGRTTHFYHSARVPDGSSVGVVTLECALCGDLIEYEVPLHVLTGERDDMLAYLSGVQHERDEKLRRAKQAKAKP